MLIALGFFIVVGLVAMVSGGEAETVIAGLFVLLTTYGVVATITQAF